MKAYKLRVHLDVSEKGYVEVPVSQEFECKGHKFFIHRPFIYDKVADKNWSISHITTGLRVSRTPKETRKLAKEAAISFMSTVKSFDKTFKEGIDKYGILNNI